ncbi:MAG: hypothetical protein H6947_12410 [Zoogloeaceae bacterium]|nr:hypothetical protein [Planctomycetota bacterium]MCP5255236.1 hypothetical protein [Zoogloeaceae bacterium]MCP5311888.1 hypothetical protein [Zoogloeaceae bacterium]
MRKFVIFFLVLFVPLQWGTAVLAAYCLHEESSAATQHIGHHAHHHEHKGNSVKSDEGQKGKAWDASCSADHDHSHCTHAIVHESHSPRIFAAGTNDSPYAVFVSDAPPDSRLRPPQATLV